MPRPVLVSACLLGLATRYDGVCKRNPRVLAHLRANDLVPVPVCPEQLAGLPTPRPRTCFAAGDGDALLDGHGSVENAHGEVVNQVFLKGAATTLEVARLAGCREALLKERSPSCGSRSIYLRDDLVAGTGVTAALLRRNGIAVLGETDLE